LPWYLVALSESQEIGTILPFVQSRDPGEISSVLKAVLSGPEMPSDEDQALNQPRNIQFELWLATTLWRAGAAVALREPDLECTLSGTRILVACKRLFSLRKLTRRINEATEQLRHAVRATSATGGIIAISLSRVLGATDRSQQIAGRPQAMAILASRIENVVERRAKWRQSHEAQAILFQLASMFTNLATDRIESGSFITMYGDGPVAATVAQALQSVAE